MKKLLTGILLVAASVQAQQPATIREYNKDFPTYGFSDPSPLPLLNAVYPYFRYDGFTDKAVNKSWKVVELENDYLRLLILPEIGGKIWAAIEKSTNRPFFYYNHAVKFRDVAMRGPWTSGGLEANYGIIGHTPNCATPVDYLTRTNADGSVSCIIGTLDLLSRSYWRMEIRLPKDQALFSTRSFWYNTTAMEQPYYHWMNAGLKAGQDLEFIYPGNRYLGHNGEYADWPIDKDNGKNISWYKNNDFGGYKSYHVFGKYAEFSGAYWHNDDYGMVRYGRHDDKAGKKLWIWGLSGQGMIWEKLLSDTDGQYIELQSGRLFNQNDVKSSLTPFKHRALLPFETDTWEEDWYPVLGTQGFVAASEYGALNLRYADHRLSIWFSPTRSFDDTLRITIDGKPAYVRAAAFSPLHLFTDSLQTDSGHFVVTIGDHRFNHDSAHSIITSGPHRLFYDSDPSSDILARPVQAPAGFDWTSAYGNYIKGTEAMDQKHYAEAEEALQSSLQKDSNYGPALTQYAALLYRNMRYQEALTYATRALGVNTEDGQTNFIYGLINQALGHWTDAKDGFDIAALDPAFRSAAYTCLARISLKESDLARARLYAEKAMINNALDIEALQLQAVCARPNNGDLLATIDSLDPLNHFSRFEKYLSNPTETNKQRFLLLIRNELPQETFLELGIWYYNCGLPDEALKVFRLAPPNAETSLWIARLTTQPIDWTTIDPVRAFPFRPETAQLLEERLKTDDHWFLKYQLALICKDRNRLSECKQLLLSCGDTPGYAPFYAFRAALLDSPLHDLQRAAALDPQWRYQKLLTEYFLRKEEYTKALATIEPFYQSHPDGNTMGLLYARALLSTRQFGKADRLFSQLHVLPTEGATSGRELYRETKLMEAVDGIKNKQYKKALGFIAAARQWPENLGVGAPYLQDQDLRIEDWLTTRCRVALQKTPPPPPFQAKTSLDNRVLNALQ
jgi:hypothetical protein